jgi:hypothetical protein
MPGWADFPFAYSKVYFVLLSCVACCVIFLSRCWLSSAVSLEKWRGEVRVFSFMSSAVEIEVSKSYLSSFVFDVSSMGHSE